MGLAATMPILDPMTLHASMTQKDAKYPPVFILPMSPLKSLDLTKNKIEYLPHDLRNLEKLNLQQNSLETISPELVSSITTYINLAALGLFDNSLSEFPQEIADMPSLKYLSLGLNNFSKWNMDLKGVLNLSLNRNQFTTFDFCPSNLISLDLSFNKIVNFSFNSERLSELSLDGNDLVALPDVQLPNLVLLSLNHNLIKTIDNIIDIAPKLEILYISYNELTEIPQMPATMSIIEALGNHISSIHESVLESQALAVLGLRENKIKSIGKLPQSLRTLRITENSLESIVFSPCQQINEIILNNNKLTEMPDMSNTKATIIEIINNQLTTIDPSKIPNTVTRLEISGNKIIEIPPELFNFPELKTINLSNNHIENIPDLSHSKLTSINISHNQIAQIPPLPTSLRVFYGNDCKLTSVDALSKLPMINEISCAGNNITSIPSIPSLKSLIASRNNISRLTILPSVEYVDLSHNIIESVTLLFLNNLKCLDLSHNRIKHFGFASNKKLCVLKLAHNPLILKVDFNVLKDLHTLDIVGIKEAVLDNLTANVREILVSDKALIDNELNPHFKYVKECGRCGYSEMQGIRRTMEDSILIREGNDNTPSYYAVIDGHGGYRTSAFVATAFPLFLQQMQSYKPDDIAALFTKIQTALTGMVADGATATLVIKIGNHLISANVGDSRALLVRSDGSFVELSKDHKPYDRSELIRLREKGSFVTNQRAAGRLALSRAFGDFTVPGVCADPYIYETDIKPGDYRLLLACDGLFDVVTNAEAASICASAHTPPVAACMLRDRAYVLRSTDNISVVVIDL